MVDFELSEEQAALREFSRDLLASDCPPQTRRAVAAAGLDLDEKLWSRGAQMGWTGLAAPLEHGGAGQGIVELCLVAEELGRAAAPGPVIETALAARAAAGCAGTAEQAAALAEGQLRAGFVHHGAVTARRDGDGVGVVLSGRATAVHAAGSADWLLVATSGDEPCLALVPASDVETHRRTTLDQTRTWYDVVFPGVRVPSARVCAATRDEVDFWVHAMAVLTAADALGVAEALLEMTVAHVTVREQFGRPLGSFQAVKHKTADMRATLTGMRAATYYAAMALSDGTGDAAAASAVAKAFASEGAPGIAGEALQLHGGIGFTWEHDLHLYLRRARVDALLFGDAAHHHERVLAALETSSRTATTT